MKAYSSVLAALSAEQSLVSGSNSLYLFCCADGQADPDAKQNEGEDDGHAAVRSEGNVQLACFILWFIWCGDACRVGVMMSGNLETMTPTIHKQ